MIGCLFFVLLAQAPVATTPGAPAAAAVEDSLTGNLSLGAIVLTGNSETATFSFGAAAVRKTPFWIYGFKATAAYGRSNDPATRLSSTSALNGALTVRGDRRFGPVVSVYLEGAIDADHLKSLEARPTGEAGLSLQLIDRKDGDFQTEAVRVDLGFRGGREYRFQYYPTPAEVPDVTIAAPKAGFAGRHALTRDTVIEDELTALVNLPDGPRLVLGNVAKLSARLYRRLTFTVSYGIAEDTSPPPGKKQLDTTLMLALETTF